MVGAQWSRLMKWRKVNRIGYESWSGNGSGNVDASAGGDLRGYHDRRLRSYCNHRTDGDVVFCCVAGCQTVRWSSRSRIPRHHRFCGGVRGSTLGKARGSVGRIERFFLTFASVVAPTVHVSTRILYYLQESVLVSFTFMAVQQFNASMNGGPTRIGLLESGRSGRSTHIVISVVVAPIFVVLWLWLPRWRREVRRLLLVRIGWLRGPGIRAIVRRIVRSRTTVVCRLIHILLHGWVISLRRRRELVALRIVTSVIRRKGAWGVWLGRVCPRGWWAVALFTERPLFL